MEDDFALSYVCIYPGVNSRAELVTHAQGLRPERRLALLAQVQDVVQRNWCERETLDD